MKEKGFLEKTEPHKLAVGRCYRCQTVIEPYLTPQWFVDIKPLAEPAIAVVREGKIQDYSRRLEQFLFCLDGKHQRLVHLAANLVGPSNSRLVLSALRGVES